MTATPRQRVVLEAIQTSTRQMRRAPSVREIGTLLGIRSLNGVKDHLRLLEKKGLIEHDFQVARSLRITVAGLREIGKEPCRACGSMEAAS